MHGMAGMIFNLDQSLFDCNPKYDEKHMENNAESPLSSPSIPQASQLQHITH
jgi:hypothetical protein